MQLARSIAFMAYFVISILMTGTCAIPVILLAPKTARPIAKAWARSNLFMLKLLAGVGYKIEGAEHVPDFGALVAANHQSQWETMALYALLPRPVIILKKELLRIPIYGWWLQQTGNIAVDRRGGAKALRAMRREAAARIAAGEQIVVFPEGTRSAVGERLSFQSGVAGIYKEVNGPCVPVAHNSGEHWRYPGILKTPGEITLRFLPAIAPGLDRKEFLPTLQAQIEQARPDLEDATDHQEPSDD
ncbi:MAG: 1-acyl-sn-glycerol-3-phosphate acyltransferase [Pseudomonadota bacterium]